MQYGDIKMPYITKDRRVDVVYDPFNEPKSAGELNYLLTSLVHAYIDRVHGKLSYAAINEVMGVLESAKLELYRQLASPYEDHKKIENGSVSKLDE